MVWSRAVNGCSVKIIIVTVFFDLYKNIFTRDCLIVSVFIWEHKKILSSQQE